VGKAYLVHIYTTLNFQLVCIKVWYLAYTHPCPYHHRHRPIYRHQYPTYLHPSYPCPYHHPSYPYHHMVYMEHMVDIVVIQVVMVEDYMNLVEEEIEVDKSEEVEGKA
jgi:hypothetical protein